MSNREPYKEGNRHFVDKDPDNKWFYVADVTDEITLNNTTAVSAVAIVHRMTVLVQPDVQEGKFIVFKVEGPSPALEGDTEDAHVTLRVTCANGEQFDKTVYYKAEED